MSRTGRFGLGRGALVAGLLTATVTLSACGPRFEVQTEVRDAKVTVFVRKLKAGDEIRIRGHAGATKVADSFQASIQIPAEAVGEGEHELVVEVVRDGKKRERTVSVDVPASALAPFLRIPSCTGLEKGHYSDGSVKVRSKAMPPSRDGQRCALKPNGAIELGLSANADAVVELAGTRAELTNGEGSGLLPITPVLHGVSLGGIGNTKASGEFPLKTQATSTRGGKTSSFELELDVELRAIRSALFESVLAMDGGKAATWPRSNHAGKPRGIAFAAKRHPVKVDGKEQTVMHPKFDHVLVAGDAHKADEIDLFAVATPHDVTRRGACKGYVSISGTGSVRNAGFVMGFDVKVYDHTGKEVAHKPFDKPKKTECPSNLSGTRGKTTILVWAPGRDDVEKWLASLVE